jgi:glycosyltransferase involved in cell wall biosynthesis
MVKVCYILGTLEVGGAERQLLLLLKKIDREKFFPVVIALRGGRMRREFEGIARVFVPGKKWKIDPFVLFRVVQVLKRERPDILHTFMFTSNTWGRLAGILAGVPVIIASERSLDLWKRPYHFLIDRFFARYTQKIVCNSQEVMKTYEKILGRYSGKLSVIYNGIETDFYDRVEYKEEIRKKLGIEKNAKVVLTGGRLSPEKGLDTLISAVPRVLKECMETRFVISGEGSEEDKLLELAKKLGVDKKVIFAGYRRDLPELIKISSIVVLPSLWEGMPNLLLEAMALKKPVIATDIGGSREIVRDAENGFLVPIRDSEKLAEKMVYLLKNNGLCRTMGDRGYGMVKEKFSADSMVKGYEELYMKEMREKCAQYAE